MACIFSVGFRLQKVRTGQTNRIQLTCALPSAGDHQVRQEHWRHTGQCYSSHRNNDIRRGRRSRNLGFLFPLRDTNDFPNHKLSNCLNNSESAYMSESESLLGAARFFIPPAILWDIYTVSNNHNRHDSLDKIIKVNFGFVVVWSSTGRLAIQTSENITNQQSMGTYGDPESSTMTDSMSSTLSASAWSDSEDKDTKELHAVLNMQKKREREANKITHSGRCDVFDLWNKPMKIDNMHKRDGCILGFSRGFWGPRRHFRRKAMRTSIVKPNLYRSCCPDS